MTYLEKKDDRTRLAETTRLDSQTTARAEPNVDPFVSISCYALKRKEFAKNCESRDMFLSIFLAPFDNQLTHQKRSFKRTHDLKETGLIFGLHTVRT